MNGCRGVHVLDLVAEVHISAYLCVVLLQKAHHVCILWRALIPIKRLLVSLLRMSHDEQNIVIQSANNMRSRLYARENLFVYVYKTLLCFLIGSYIWPLTDPTHMKLPYSGYFFTLNIWSNVVFGPRRPISYYLW